MPAQPASASLARALDDELDCQVARWRSVKRAGECYRHSDAASVVARRWTVIRARELEQKCEAQDERSGREKLGDADRSPLVTVDPEDGDSHQPDDRNRDPAQPSGSEAMCGLP